MGANQSFNADDNSGARRGEQDRGQGGGGKKCYYDLLGIEYQASEEE